MAERMEISGRSLGDVSLLGFDFQRTEPSVRSVEAVPGGGDESRVPRGKQGAPGAQDRAVAQKAPRGYCFTFLCCNYLN